MKVFLIVICSLAVAFFALQGFISKSTSKVEKYEYEVVKKYSQFEIRKYKSALFSSVDLVGRSYESTSGTGFRILAGYIFGGNQTGEEIAMTSPVAMQLNDDNRKMSFMVPAGIKANELPSPSNNKIYFEEKKACVMAAVRFGGWASQEKLDKQVEKLKQQLEKEGLVHNSNFTYFGYNPPYELVNRRNEVVVELVNYHVD